MLSAVFGNMDVEDSQLLLFQPKMGSVVLLGVAQWALFGCVFFGLLKLESAQQTWPHSLDRNAVTCVPAVRHWKNRAAESKQHRCMCISSSGGVVRCDPPTGSVDCEGSGAVRFIARVLQWFVYPKLLVRNVDLLVKMCPSKILSRLN
jgi:hypothetical protein